MEVKVLNGDYTPRRVERAIEAAMNRCLQDLCIKGKAWKFVCSYSQTRRIIEWGVHLKSESDAKKFEESIKKYNIPSLSVFYCGEVYSDYIVNVGIDWYTDKVEEAMELEASRIKVIEELLGVTIRDGFVDKHTLKGAFCWGNVEDIIFG